MKIYHHYSIYGFSNTYVIGNDVTKSALLIDPADLTAEIIEQIEHNGYALDAVLVTHNHIHHIRGLTALLRIYSPRIYASNAKLGSVSCVKLRDRDIFEEAGFSIEAIAVPGHSQDSIVYSFENCLFTGDALHAGMIGKTTSAFNANALAGRIKAKLLALPDYTMIFPGHGPPSSIATERAFNLGLQVGFADTQHQSYDFFV